MVNGGPQSEDEVFHTTERDIKRAYVDPAVRAERNRFVEKLEELWSHLPSDAAPEYVQELIVEIRGY